MIILRLVTHTAAFLLAISTPAFSQTASKQIVFKEGFITIDPYCKCLYLDTVKIADKQIIPSLLAITDTYIIAIDKCGQLYTSPLSHRTPVYKTAFSSKKCTVQLDYKSYMTLSDNNTLFFVHSVDGYLSPRRFRLVKLNLDKSSFEIIDTGKQFDKPYFSDNFRKINYVKDGVLVTRPN